MKPTAMYAINFYSDLYLDYLRTNRKSLTVRLGDKTEKYRDPNDFAVTVLFCLVAEAHGQ